MAVLRATLAECLGRRPRTRPKPVEHLPSVDLLLEVDRLYRQKAEADELPMIAPKRFNPEGKAWLPVLHTSRDGWHFTVLYSNTARAIGWWPIFTTITTRRGSAP